MIMDMWVTQSHRKCSLRTPETVTSVVLFPKAEPIIYKLLTAVFPIRAYKRTVVGLYSLPWLSIVVLNCLYRQVNHKESCLSLLQQFNLLLHFRVFWSGHGEQFSLLHFLGVWRKGGRCLQVGSGRLLRAHLWEAGGEELSPRLPGCATQLSTEPGAVWNGSRCCPCRWVLGPLGI